MLDAYGLAAAQFSEWRRRQIPADSAKLYEEFLASYEPGPITRMVEWFRARRQPLPKVQGRADLAEPCRGSAELSLLGP